MTDSPHIERLKRRVDNTADQLQKERDYHKAYRERVREIMDAPPVHRTGFWCDHCQRDVVAVGYRTSFAWRSGWPCAKYQAHCPKGHALIRRITDKDGDPYYHKSLILKKDRHTHADDLLQPSDPRFKYVYPEAWKKLQAQQHNTYE